MCPARSRGAGDTFVPLSEAMPWSASHTTALLASPLHPASGWGGPSVLPLGARIHSGPSPRRHHWQRGGSSRAGCEPGCGVGLLGEGAEAAPACGRREGARLGFRPALEGTSSAGGLRPGSCSPGRWWVPALDPHPAQGCVPWTGVQQFKEHPEAPCCRSCPAPAFPPITDTPLPSRGVSWHLRAVSFCLKGAWHRKHGQRQHPAPGRSSCGASHAVLAPALGVDPSSHGRLCSAARPVFTLPGCAPARRCAPGTLPCLACGGGPVLPQPGLLQGPEEPCGEPGRCSDPRLSRRGRAGVRAGCCPG